MSIFHILIFSNIILILEENEFHIHFPECFKPRNQRQVLGYINFHEESDVCCPRVAVRGNTTTSLQPLRQVNEIT